VVHGIAAQSGGLLHIESAPNVGTTIELWLPRSNTRSVSVRREFDNLAAGINGQ